jgi:hypothetical protein
MQNWNAPLAADEQRSCWHRLPPPWAMQNRVLPADCFLQSLFWHMLPKRRRFEMIEHVVDLPPSSLRDRLPRVFGNTVALAAGACIVDLVSSSARATPLAKNVPGEEGGLSSILGGTIVFDKQKGTMFVC